MTASAGTRPAAPRRATRRRSSTDRDGGRPPLSELLPPATLLVAALLLGGSANPINDMVVDGLAVLLLAIMAIRFDARAWRRSQLGWALLLATAAIAAIELVPLPYALWRTLPGRGTSAAILDTLRLSGAARPLSLDPSATVSTLVQVLPGLAMFIAVLAASGRTRRTLVSILIAGAGACIVLGTLQMTGQRQFYLYQRSNFGNLTGLFANHNHAADLLLIGIALLAGRLREVGGQSGGRILIGAMMLLLAIGVLLSASRTGIVLLAAEVAAITLFLRAPTSRRSWMTVGLALAICAGIVGLLTLSPGVQRSLDRFDTLSGDLRTEIWDRTTLATGRYWPVGSGLGTFVPVYASVERLDTMPVQIINHAHDEYLELVLELGLVGAIVILGYVAGLVWQVTLLVRERSHMPVVPALLGILVLLGSSTVEFPLRNASLMATFGVLNGLIFAALRRGSRNNP